MPASYWSPSEPAGDHDDPDHVRAHFDPVSSDLTRGRYTRVARTMARECPVIHTDGFADGIWTVSGYEQRSRRRSRRSTTSDDLRAERSRCVCRHVVGGHPGRSPRAEEDP